MIRRRELLGLAALGVSLGGAAAGVGPAAALLHPVAGTALTLLADGGLERRRDSSPLVEEPQALVWMATLSIFLWFAVEALNERRGLWAYLGWPSDDLLRYAALGWMFATILPFIALLAEFLGGASAWVLRPPSPAVRFVPLAGAALFGLALRGGSPDESGWWLSAGVAGLFLIGAGLRQPPRRLAVWAAAGVMWIALSETLDSIASAERFIVSPDGFTPALWPAALLLGPALGGLYQSAVRTFGLTGWPAQDAAESSDRILS